MDKLISLYEFAKRNNIGIESFKIGSRKSTILNTDTGPVIAMNYSALENSIEERECLVHELAHYKTGTYYNLNTRFEIRARKEYRANRCAIMEHLPFADLLDAFQKGIIEVWELAEHFEVSEDCIRLAITIYEKQGLLPISA